MIYFFTKKQNAKRDCGFTLVELMLSLAIFSVVMLAGVTALFGISYANRRAHIMQLSYDNVNFAMESMVRTIRLGTSFHCEYDDGTPITTPRDCPMPTNGTVSQSYAKSIAFEGQLGSYNSSSDQIIFRLNTSTYTIERSIDSGLTWVPITSSQIKINQLHFYVYGAALGDNVQPRVIITVQGEATIDSRNNTKIQFALQTTAVQRIFDK